ncbi:MAG: circularly permuted type 2 ATP-grasp protein [Acidimicrobiales bacterium]
MQWAGYSSNGYWDELIEGGGARPGCEAVVAQLARMSLAELRDRQAAADAAISARGVTFSVYAEGGNIDRPWPFDVIPRVLSSQDWANTSKGLVQRLTALNLFIADLYGPQKVLRDKVIPADIVAGSVNFRPQCVGMVPAAGTWAHICGSDLVRGGDGTLYVLEDNLRVPSGVSYLLENRQISKLVFPALFRNIDIQPVDGYVSRLYDMLASLSPRPGEVPVIVVLTPGVYNSAYFEHSSLAQQMGAPLVQGSDLIVGEDDCVYLATIGGPQRVDVIYRRIDDLFLDPEVFRSDSVVGVAGLMRAWRAGNVALANAPGAGVADDKVVYAYVPELIRYYLGEDPLIPNVPTFLCDDPLQRQHVLANLAELVVKPANESGGYGILIGPRASASQLEDWARRIEADPRNWVAQPVVALSTVPTLRREGVVARHVDLRPFVLSGDHPYVTEGGLSRVALVEGSLVVNSSQGGGSKDTWVLDPTFRSAGDQRQPEPGQSALTR